MIGYIYRLIFNGQQVALTNSTAAGQNRFTPPPTPPAPEQQTPPERFKFFSYTNRENETMSVNPLEASINVTPGARLAGPSTEEDNWATAMAEVESAQRRLGLWAKAFAESDGDETKAKVVYLKSRVKQLIDAQKLIQSQQEAMRQQTAEIAQAEALVRKQSVDAAMSTFASNQEISNEQLRLIVQFADTPHRISLWNPSTGDTLLHVCAERDMLTEVDELLKAGADPQRTNNSGKRPKTMAKSRVTAVFTGAGISADQLKHALEFGVEQVGDQFTFAGHKFQRLQEAIDYAIAVSKMPKGEWRNRVWRDLVISKEPP